MNISYVLQKNLVLFVIKSSFDESVLSIERWANVKIPKRQAKKVIINAAKDFEEFYNHKKIASIPSAIRRDLMILTSDGKGVVMLYYDLRFDPKKRASRQNRNNKLTKPKKSNSKRMATVASVYETDRFIREPKDIHNEFFNKSASKEKMKRPSPIAKRVWAGLENSSEYIIHKMFEEALQRVDSVQKEWVVLVDGDRNQIETIKKLARKFDKKLTIICDIIHILEYIFRFGKVLNDTDDVRKWVSDKFDMILNGKSSYVASGMKRSATCRKLKKTEREPVDSCARYLLNHSNYLHYDKYLKSGYPIATGVIEGACRYLVKDRMEITGARWSLSFAVALLKLRSIKISGDFDDYWKFYENQEFYRNYQVLYKNPSMLKMPS
jgi:hypothetical protein